MSYKKYAVLFFISYFSSPAFSYLQVFPTRVNLSNTEKTATVSIRLRADKPETFRISTMFYEMNYDGSVRQRPDLSRSPESAAPYIRFSPKKVELQPNVEQVVRIRVKNVFNLKKEVRTHLYFRPVETTNVDPITQNIGGSKSALELKAKVAVAIPIVISPRKINKDFELKKFKVYVEGDEAKFKVQLKNKSDGFLYGDFTIYKVLGKKSEIVGVAKGVSSYIKNREVSYDLVNDSKNPLTKGLYRLQFKEYSQTAPEKGNVKNIDYVYK